MIKKEFKMIASSFTIFFLLLGCLPSNNILRIPISLHKAGSTIEADFEIEQDDSVSLSLWFFVNKEREDRDHLMDFLGRTPRGINHPITKSVVIPLKVKIIKYTDTTEIVILNKIYVTSGIHAIAENELERLIDELRIKSGKYRIRLETINEFLQLSHTKIEFELSYIRAPK